MEFEEVILARKLHRSLEAALLARLAEMPID
jgi:hypothetical protein